MKKIRDFLVKLKNNNPWLLLLWHEQLRLRGIKDLKNNSDLEAINKLYFNFSGKYPNLKNPQTFSEKQQWMKLNYHNALMARCADKLEVRSYIEEKGYGDILNELIASYDNIDDFDIAKLPKKFVLKASHGSGWNLVVKDKSKINWKAWRLVLKSWLNSNIYWLGREWSYKNMKPSIVCEKYLEDSSGQLMDYKLFCFDGETKFVQANKGRDTDKHAQNFYDLDWKLLPFGKSLKPMPEVKIDKPKSLKQMIDITYNLSKDLPFARIDFYEVKGKVIFGEMTFYPISGLPDFIPIAYDKIIGDMLSLPSKQI